MTYPDAYDDIMAVARKKGVGDVVIITTDLIPVDPKFAAFCKDPGCSGYGLSMSCPPYAKGPEWFAAKIQEYRHALIFKYEIPTSALLGNERLPLLGLIQETAALLETVAHRKGYTKALGFAGGSCKEVFCSDHHFCQVLHDGAPCRNPDKARQSMSSAGVNFLKLSKTVGWKMKTISQDTNSEKTSMGILAGLVLLD